MSGLAGFLHGLLLLHPRCCSPRDEDLRARLGVAIDETARALVASCRGYAARSGCRAPLMSACDGVEYLGAARGICGVLQQLVLARPHLQVRWPRADWEALDRDILSTFEYLARCTRAALLAFGVVG